VQGQERTSLAVPSCREAVPSAGAWGSVVSRLSRAAGLGTRGNSTTPTIESSDGSPGARYAVATSPQQQQHQQRQQQLANPGEHQQQHVVRRLYAAGAGLGEAAVGSKGSWAPGIDFNRYSPVGNKTSSSTAAATTGLITAGMDFTSRQAAGLVDGEPPSQLTELHQAHNSSSRLAVSRDQGVGLFTPRGPSCGAGPSRPLVMFEEGDCNSGEVEFTSSSPVIISISPVPPSTADGSPVRVRAGPSSREWLDPNSSSKRGHGMTRHPLPGGLDAGMGADRPAGLFETPKAWRIMHGHWPST
jgi:hypothetical protein